MQAARLRLRHATDRPCGRGAQDSQVQPCHSRGRAGRGSEHHCGGALGHGEPGRAPAEGLAFSRPAVLTMSYGNCKVIPQSKQIAYTTDSLVILQYVPSSDTPTAKLVTGRLSHFSNYAIAW